MVQPSGQLQSSKWRKDHLGLKLTLNDLYPIFICSGSGIVIIKTYSEIVRAVPSHGTYGIHLPAIFWFIELYPNFFLALS